MLKLVLAEVKRKNKSTRDIAQRRSSSSEIE
jgi:hypothetical protein